MATEKAKKIWDNYKVIGEINIVTGKQIGRAHV